MYEKCGGRCAYCGKVVTLKTMHVDHVKPKIRGGTDSYCNLLPSCRTCNLSKNSKRFLSFKEYFYKTKEKISEKIINSEDFMLPKNVFYFEKLGLVDEFEWRMALIWETEKNHIDAMAKEICKWITTSTLQ